MILEVVRTEAPDIHITRQQNPKDEKLAQMMILDITHAHSYSSDYARCIQGTYASKS